MEECTTQIKIIVNEEIEYHTDNKQLTYNYTNLNNLIIYDHKKNEWMIYIS